MFVELIDNGFISIENEVLHLVNPALQNDEIHEFILNQIRMLNKDLNIRTWISWFNWRSSKIKKMFIRSLVKKNILRTEEKWFFFIPYDKVYLRDRDLVESIRKEIESVLLKRTEPNDQFINLAQMVNQNNILDRIFPDKSKRKEAALNLKAFSDTPISKATKQAIFRRIAFIAASR